MKNEKKSFGAGKPVIGQYSLPCFFFVFLFMAILFIVISKNTKYGKTNYAVGSNEKSARLAGINVSIPGLSVDIQDTFRGLLLIIVILIQTAIQRAEKRRQTA